MIWCTFDPAIKHALAHVSWARRTRKMTPFEIGRSIGRRDVWTWDAAVEAVAAAWRALPASRRSPFWEAGESDPLVATPQADRREEREMAEAFR